MHIGMFFTSFHMEIFVSFTQESNLKIRICRGERKKDLIDENDCNRVASNASEKIVTIITDH